MSSLEYSKGSSLSKVQEILHSEPSRLDELDKEVLFEAFQQAVKSNDVEVANYCLKERKFNPNTELPDGEASNGCGSLLHYAVQNKLHDVASALLNAGAQTERASLMLSTPLVMAAEADDETMVRILIEAGAEVATCDGIFLNTPLHIAVRLGNFDMIRTLLEGGHPKGVVNLYGQTPEMLIPKDRPEITEFFS